MAITSSTMIAAEIRCFTFLLFILNMVKTSINASKITFTLKGYYI